MNYYSVPSDFKKETIDEYERLNREYDDGMVLETYGSITRGKVLASGRLVRQMQKIDFLDLYEYIQYSSDRGIGFNYTLNPTHFQNREFTEEGVSVTKEHLHKLYEAGVRSITVTLPSLMELVQSTGLDFKIRTSCLCQIRNANRAMAYKNMGVDKIVVDESINRDFYALKSIRKGFGEKVEIIVNQICDQNCMYRMFHYNMISGDPDRLTSQVSINYYEHRCVLQQLKTIDNCLKLCWVRPEDLHYYTDIGINYFKIQGRHAFVQGGDAVKTVKAYLDKSYDGNLMDLLMMFGDLTKFKVNLDNKKLDGYIKPFVENDRFCRHNCGECKYCENFLRKRFDVVEIENIRRMAGEFLGEYDQYKKLLQSVRREEIQRVPTDINADFDL